MTKRFLILVTFLALLTGLGVIPALAQNLGTIKGTAKDENGKPIADASVELDNTDNGSKQTVKTNGKGEYFSQSLEPGTYNVILVRDGKRVDAFGKVPVAAGHETTVNFDLKKDLAGAISPEEQKKIDEIKAQNEKITNLNALLKQAHDLEKAGNYDQAVTMLQPAAEQNPKEDVIWGMLGDGYRGAKKYPEAIDAYSKALAIKPDNAGYMSGLADAYAKSDQIDKAVQEYDAAAKAAPANAGVYYFNEGVVFTNKQKPDQAVAAFQKAITADPNKAEAYYYKGENMIGLAKLENGKMVAPPGTAEAFNKYLELKPDGPLAAQAKAYLEALGSKVETTYGKGKSAPKKQ